MVKKLTMANYELLKVSEMANDGLFKLQRWQMVSCREPDDKGMIEKHSVGREHTPFEEVGMVSWIYFLLE